MWVILSKKYEKMTVYSITRLYKRFPIITAVTPL